MIQGFQKKFWKQEMECLKQEMELFHQFALIETKNFFYNMMFI